VSELTRRRMTSDEFIAWATKRPETEHYELIDGEVMALAPERSAHALTKFHIARRMAEALEAGSLRIEHRTMVHHERGENGIILTRIVRDGAIMMDPPWITLTDCFPPGVA
jgi:Uma2 family endonuclease